MDLFKVIWLKVCEDLFGLITYKFFSIFASFLRYIFHLPQTVNKNGINATWISLWTIHYFFEKSPRDFAFYLLQIQCGSNTGLQLFIWKIIQGLVSNNTRLNPVFSVLTTINLHLPHPLRKTAPSFLSSLDFLPRHQYATLKVNIT